MASSSIFNIGMVGGMVAGAVVFAPLLGVSVVGCVAAGALIGGFLRKQQVDRRHDETPVAGEREAKPLYFATHSPEINVEREMLPERSQKPQGHGSRHEANASSHADHGGTGFAARLAEERSAPAEIGR